MLVHYCDPFKMLIIANVPTGCLKLEPHPEMSYLSRNALYMNVVIRTIEIAQCARILNANFC